VGPLGLACVAPPISSTGALHFAPRYSAVSASVSTKISSARPWRLSAGARAATHQLKRSPRQTDAHQVGTPETGGRPTNIRRQTRPVRRDGVHSVSSRINLRQRHPLPITSTVPPALLAQHTGGPRPRSRCTAARVEPRAAAGAGPGATTTVAYCSRLCARTLRPLRGRAGVDSVKCPRVARSPTRKRHEQNARAGGTAAPRAARVQRPRRTGRGARMLARACGGTVLVIGSGVTLRR